MADSVTIVIEGQDEVAVIVSQGDDMLKTVYDPSGVQADVFDRSKHTGTQTASTISDFDTEVSNNTDVATNTAARHTHSNKATLDAITAAYTTAEKTKLDGIEAGATADLTAGEIKTLYEGNSDTNAYTDAEKTKLSGIEANADVTDATNVDAAGATMNTDTDVSGNSWVDTDADTGTTSDITVPTVKKVASMISSGGLDANDLLGLIKTVDGSGSELDADLLDGHDSSYFVATTGNAATASALETARTISLDGDATGNVDFDGSANVTLTVAVVDDSHTHDGRYFTETESDARYLGKNANAVSATRLYNSRNINLTGDVTGSASFDGTANASITATVQNDSHTHDGRYYTEAECDGSFLGISATAAAATKLATARTITLSGDVSGSASFDGSANVTITSTIDSSEWAKRATVSTAAPSGGSDGDVWYKVSS